VLLIHGLYGGRWWDVVKLLGDSEGMEEVWHFAKMTKLSLNTVRLESRCALRLK
jgi:hypothetical protein